MAASVQDMGIDHGRADILVPREFLDGADVIACFKQMRGKGMSQGVTTDMLNYASIADCFLDTPLKNRLMSVMPSLVAGLSVINITFHNIIKYIKNNKMSSLLLKKNNFSKIRIAVPP